MSELKALLAEAAEATRPSMDGLGRVSAVVQSLRDLEARAARLTNQLGLIEEQARVLRETDLPALFDEYSLREFVMDDGCKLAIQQTYVGKITEDDKPKAFSWLETHGYGDLVKTAVEAQFAMGEYEKAKKLQATLLAQGLQVKASQSVHSATLGKFVKTRLQAGKDVPSLFNPSVLRKAKFS